MENLPLLLVGGGGHCKSVIEAAESVGRTVLGVLDMPEDMGKQILSTRVIGTDDDIPVYVGKVEFVISVGFIKSPTTRIRLYNMVKDAGGCLATIVASTACVSKYASVGDGAVVLHHALVNADASIGSNVIINSFANIEHGVRVGNQCHVSTGAVINGNCCVGERCFIGSQAVLANGITVCDDVMIGAGAVVTRDITVSGIYTGNPAKLK